MNRALQLSKEAKELPESLLESKLLLAELRNQLYSPKLLPESRLEEIRNQLEDQIKSLITSKKFKELITRELLASPKFSKFILKVKLPRQIAVDPELKKYLSLTITVNLDPKMVKEYMDKLIEILDKENRVLESLEFKKQITIKQGEYSLVVRRKQISSTRNGYVYYIISLSSRNVLVLQIDKLTSSEDFWSSIRDKEFAFKEACVQFMITDAEIRKIIDEILSKLLSHGIVSQLLMKMEILSEKIKSIESKKNTANLFKRRKYSKELNRLKAELEDIDAALETLIKSIIDEVILEYSRSYRLSPESILSVASLAFECKDNTCFSVTFQIKPKKVEEAILSSYNKQGFIVYKIPLNL